MMIWTESWLNLTRLTVVRIDLKGIAKVRSKGRTYFYAWRGGPRLRGELGSAEFVASYLEAHETRRTPDKSRFRSLVTIYKAEAFPRLAPSTKKNWAPWLDRIADYFGDLRIAQFDRPEKIRPVIRRWRNQWAEKPRTADYGMQVLSAVLSHAVDPLGKIASNPCEGIKQLYSADRAEVIWTDADTAKLKAVCPQEVVWAFDLATHTGLRLGDLLRLTWASVGEDAILIVTSKSGKRRCEAIIPIYDALRDVLACIPKRSPTVLTNSLGRPWKRNGFGTAFNRAKIKAGLSDGDGRDLNFHDTKGTAVTKFYIAGLPMRAIAEIVGWSEANVEKIIRKYVDRSAATRAVIALLNERRT